MRVMPPLSDWIRRLNEWKRSADSDYLRVHISYIDSLLEDLTAISDELDALEKTLRETVESF